MKPFIIAEVSGNHLGSLTRALQLVDKAAAAGASAVKFQCFTPEQMADPGAVVESGPWAGRALLDLYRETWTPQHWFDTLFAYVKSAKMVPMASVFHPDDVNFLEGLKCPIYKIASFELTDHPLITRAAQTGKPLMLSTGMASGQEVWDATAAAVAGGATDITVLKCTSGYPAPIAEANLAALKHMRKSIWSDEPNGWKGVLIGAKPWPALGLSDHTLGHTCAVVAVAYGATVIEKHLTLARSDGGPDAAFSAEPAEFAALVQACNEASEAIGLVRYGPTDSEQAQLPLRRPPGGKRGSVAVVT